MARLPNVLAGGRVDADDPLPLGRLAWIGPQDRVELAAHDNRRAAATQIVTLPEQVAAVTGAWLAARVNRVGQTRFARDAVAFRAAPVRPIQGIHLTAGDGIGRESRGTKGCPNNHR